MYKEYNLKEVSEEEIYLNELTNSNNWYYLCTNCKLSEEIMEKFVDKLVFDSITMNQKLSEKFIDKYYDRFSWNYIAIFQPLSEPFIAKHSNRIN